MDKRFGEVDYLGPIGYILLLFYKPLLVCILHGLVKNTLMKKYFSEFSSPVGVCMYILTHFLENIYLSASLAFPSFSLFFLFLFSSHLNMGKRLTSFISFCMNAQDYK